MVYIVFIQYVPNFQCSAGDMEFKQNKFLSAENQIVTANPDINTVSLFVRKLANFLRDTYIDLPQFPNCNMVETIVKGLVWNLRTYCYFKFSLVFICYDG